MNIFKFHQIVQTRTRETNTRKLSGEVNWRTWSSDVSFCCFVLFVFNVLGFLWLVCSFLCVWMIALFVFVHCVVLRAFCALMNQRESHFFWSWWLSEAYISCVVHKTKSSKVEIQELCFRCGCKGGTSVSHRCHFDFTSIRFVAFDSKCCSVFSVLLSILLLRPKMVPGFSGKWRAPMAKYLFTATWMVKGRHQRAQPMIYSPNSACAWRILTSSLSYFSTIPRLLVVSPLA